MIKEKLIGLGERSAAVSQRIVPDPWVLVVLLTLVTVVATFASGAGPAEAMNAWNNGVWDLLTFMAQISITLIMGDAIAKSRVATKLFRRIASVPKTRFSAVYITAFVSLIAGLVSWAMGLIIGAVMARQVAFRAHKRGLKVHYPLLVAAGYTALMIWHMGITTSSGLMMTDPAAIPESFPEYVQNGIALSETIGSTVNIATIILLLLTVPPVMALLHPRKDGKITELPQGVINDLEERTTVTDGGEIAEDTVSEARSDQIEDSPTYIADRLENMRAIGFVIALFPAYFAAHSLYTGGISGLNLNTINAMFMTGALLLWSKPLSLVEQMNESVKNCAGILLQFPFYAGIAGLLTYTSLGDQIAMFFANIATPATWPVIGLISTGLVNFFVPSGGGQWVAQGPILLETTTLLGMEPWVAVILESFGDGLTNMIQPFWAIPALALADLRARDMLGYTFIAMLIGGLVMAVTLTVFIGIPAA